jgi:hypothetical protein
MLSLFLGYKVPCTYLVQRSADEHSSTCLCSVLDFFLYSFLIHAQHLLNVLMLAANKIGITKNPLFMCLSYFKFI